MLSSLRTWRQKFHVWTGSNDKQLLVYVAIFGVIATVSAPVVTYFLTPALPSNQPAAVAGTPTSASAFGAASSSGQAPHVPVTVDRAHTSVSSPSQPTTGHSTEAQESRSGPPATTPSGALSGTAGGNNGGGVSVPGLDQQPVRPAVGSGKFTAPTYGYKDESRGDVVRIQIPALDDRTRNLILSSFGAATTEFSADTAPRTLVITQVAITKSADALSTGCVSPEIVRLAYEIRGPATPPPREGVGRGFVCLEQEANGEMATRTAISKAVADVKAQIARAP
jgi:hypothetical protein